MLLRTGKGRSTFACRKATETITKSIRRQYAIAEPLTEPLEDFQAKPQGVKGFDSVKVSTLDNGIKVASMETSGALARVSVYAKAGSRYETAGNLGISHELRNSALMSSKDRTALHIVRETAQNGATLGVTTTREHCVYSGGCLTDRLPAMLGNIASAICDPLFYPWELKEASHLTKLDNTALAMNPQIGTLELLHAAAYRTGLGNSLYCPEDKVGSYTPEEMSDFQKAHFVGERLAVVGLGVNHNTLVDQVAKAFGGLSRGGPAEVPKQQYYGGELRSRNSDGLAHFAIAAEGGGLLHKDFLALGLLQRILGVTPYIKWGSHTVSSRINKAVLEVTNSGFAASALNIGYADSGLFGFYAIVDPKHAKQVLKAIIGEFGSIAKGNISSDEIARARNQLKSAVLMSSESHDGVTEDIAIQAFNKGSYTSPYESINEIDSITVEDVVAVAQRLFAGKIVNGLHR